MRPLIEHNNGEILLKIQATKWIHTPLEKVENSIWEQVFF